MENNRIHEFHKEELFSNESIEAIYASTFVGCVFRNCYLNFNASYVKFLNCQFIDCRFGKYTRNKRAVVYKCNFDKCYFNECRGVKFKCCSLNGAVIDHMMCCTIVKCSDKYLTIMNAEDTTKVTHKNVTFKIVSMNATKPKDTKVVTSGGSTENSN